MCKEKNTHTVMMSVIAFLARHGSMQKNLNTSYTFIQTILLGTPRKQSDAQRCMC